MMACNGKCRHLQGVALGQHGGQQVVCGRCAAGRFEAPEVGAHHAHLAATQGKEDVSCIAGRVTSCYGASFR